jgi:hypothetical protein
LKPVSSMSQISKTPNEAEEAFYASFLTLDADRMDSIWAVSSEVFCIHPGGELLRGRDAVMKSWLDIFASSDPPRLEYRLLYSRHEEKVAIHLVEEDIRPRGSSHRGALVLSTNIYVSEGEGWRLFSHHASLPMLKRGGAEPDRKMH